ncbi:MAG TPA: hypothetical protein VFZ63_06090 [Jiangellaceae bacterium]
MWYAVTLDRKSTLTIDTAGSDYDTVLSVFRGTGFPNFDLAACNDDAEDLQARVSVSVARGETVYVQVGAFGGEPSAAGQLEISFTRGSKQATKKPLVFKSSFRGTQAFAEWFTEDENAFSDTFTVVTNGRTKFGKGKPTRGPALEVFHFAEEFDPVTETFTVTDFFGFTTLTDSQFHIDRKLRSASVDADLTLEGSRCVYDDANEKRAGTVSSSRPTLPSQSRGTEWDRSSARDSPTGRPATTSASPSVAARHFATPSQTARSSET